MNDHAHHWVDHLFCNLCSMFEIRFFKAVEVVIY